MSQLVEDKEVRTMSLAQNPLSELNEDGEWVSLKVKVLQLWESNSDSISQVGLLGDETAKIKFVSWKKADLPDLEEGAT
ncbi:MAG: replication protein A, partial [Candidatus Natronoplasma sp.]